MNITLPRNSLVIYSVSDNGFIVNTKGTWENQRDEMDGVYVFETRSALMDFINDHYERKRTENTAT